MCCPSLCPRPEPMNQSGFLDRDEITALGFAEVGARVQIDRSARFYGAERIRIGSDVRIDAYSVLSAGADGISIGKHVHLAVYVFLTGRARIELRDFCGLSGRVSVYSSNDDYLGDALTGPTIPEELRKVTHAPVIVGRHVVVGAGSVILPGVTIGEGACVGALSLVKQDVPEFTIVAGQKLHVIGPRRTQFLELEPRLRAMEADKGSSR